ncbi:MAG: hypothetical protein Q7J34_00710 [Bacteroidales bacterium]|nr:hypothetical protein [Bacteroidales bacterium]
MINLKSIGFILVCLMLMNGYAQKVEIAKRSSKLDSWVFNINPERIKKLLVEDVDVHMTKTHLLVSPDGIYQMELPDGDTSMAAVKTFMKRVYPDNSLRNFDVIKSNYISGDTTKKGKLLVVSSVVPPSGTKLQLLPPETRIDSIKIVKIKHAWFLAASGQYQSRKIGIYYRLHKSGERIFLKYDKRPRMQTSSFCLQRDPKFDCVPILSYDFTCYCEGTLPPKYLCNPDIEAWYGIGGISNYGLESLLNSESLLRK